MTLFGGRDVGAASAPTEAGVQTSIKSYGAELKFSTHFRKPEVCLCRMKVLLLAAQP